MRNNFFLLLFLFFQIGFSQEEKPKKHKFLEDTKSIYKRLEFSCPLRVNQYAGDIDPYTGEKEPWFLFDGITFRAGIGTHIDKWIGLGVNMGIDWKGKRCLVVAPVYGTFRLSPRISEDIRVTTEIGYGRALSISGDKLSGNFKKISLSLEDEEQGYGLYVELCQYGFTKITPEQIGSFMVGINYTIF